MSGKLQKYGKKFLSELISGSDRKISGMYISYGPEACDVQDVSPAYFETLANTPKCGYMRVRITNSRVDENNNIVFTAMATASEAVGYKPSSKSVLTMATLCYLDKDNKMNDIMVYTTPQKNSVKLSSDAYITINVVMAIGE